MSDRDFFIAPSCKCGGEISGTISRSNLFCGSCFKRYRLVEEK